MRAVITVIGKDMVGILAGVSNICVKYNVNIMEVSQSIMQDLFAMIMLADISDSNAPFAQLSDELKEYGRQNALSVHIMHDKFPRTARRTVGGKAGKPQDHGFDQEL